MSLGLVGRKVGMTRVFTDEGDSVPVTVAVSDRAPPAAAVIWPVIVTVQACPAARVAALHVTVGLA